MDWHNAKQLASGSSGADRRFPSGQEAGEMQEVLNSRRILVLGGMQFAADIGCSGPHRRALQIKKHRLQEYI